MAIALSTASGLRIGDTVERVESIYAASFVLEVTEDDEGDPEFRISNTTGLLLWGPLTSTDPDGTVEGLFVSVVCEDG